MSASESGNKELRKITRKLDRISRKTVSIFLFFSVGIFFVILALGLNYERTPIERYELWELAYYLDCHVTNFISGRNIEISNSLPANYIEGTKPIVKRILDEWASVSLSYNAILAASLILFYSIMDNRREGIPNRRIMAFAYGSMTAPILYALCMCCVPLYHFFWQSEFYYLAFVLITYVFFLQFILMIMVLTSISHRFHNYIIQKIEQRQLDYIIKNKEILDKYGVHIWAYFTIHMRVVLASSEIQSDQMVLIRDILDVPMKVERRLKKWRNLKRLFKSIIPGNNYEQRGFPFNLLNPILEHYDINDEDYYSFYYNNLVYSFAQLNYMDEKSATDTFMDVIADYLIKKVIEVYHTKESELFSRRLAIILAAIMNATFQESNDEKRSEAYCIDLLNQIISVNHFQKQSVSVDESADDNLVKMLLLVYAFYHSFRFYKAKSNNQKIELSFQGGEELKEIRVLQDCVLLDKDIDILYKVWSCWSKYENLGSLYFVETLRTIEGKTHDCVPMLHIMECAKRG